MQNMIDYVKMYKNTTFQEKKFTLVDGLILSVLSYVKYEEFYQMVLEEGKEEFSGISFAKLESKIQRRDRTRMIPFYDMTYELFRIVIRTKRYRQICLFCYEEIYHIAGEIQFAAITFELPDNSVFVAYRGTDSTLVGWKEDFNMGYINPIPSQLIGVRYLETIGKLTNRKIRVGGHSKGGNIAVYAAVHVKGEVQNQIMRVYSFDPPGFSTKIFNLPTYEKIAPRIHKIMPSSSIVGLLLEQNKEYLIIRSTGIGLFQHDPFTWDIRKGKFICRKRFRKMAQLIAYLLNWWFFCMNEKGREKMVNTIYSFLNRKQVYTL